MISKQLMADQIDSAMDSAEAATPPKTTFMVMAGVALFALFQGIIAEQAAGSDMDVQPTNDREIVSTQE